jgi:hypothetical protein
MIPGQPYRKKNEKTNLGHPILPCQILNSSQENKITPYKVNRNKLLSTIFIKPIVEE